MKRKKDIEVSMKKRNNFSLVTFQASLFLVVT